MKPARAAFQHRDFRLYLGARFLALCGHQMLLVAISQQIYEITHSPLHLGIIGLSLFLPRLGFSLLAGHTADQFDRRAVIVLCRFIQFLVVIGLALFSFFVLGGNGKSDWLWLVYVLLFLMGTANAFDGPANQAIVTQLVPPTVFGNAVTWNSSVMQIALVAGPALGGWFYALFGQAFFVFLIVAAIRFVSTLLVFFMRPQIDHIEKTGLSWKTMAAGLRYVFQKRIILGTISLDLFAVLLGGAVALMPIYANDILKVGPTGLGILRAAPSVGAALMAIILAHLPPLKRAGNTMLWCVALFGVATIFFGISRNFIFSLGCLAVLGAADMISVVVRHVLVQVQTPPAMRGRVSAINLIFIGASNELGEFESGLTAAWFGVVPAVIIGGVGTLAVVGLWAWRFPEIREFKRLDTSGT